MDKSTNEVIAAVETIQKISEDPKRPWLKTVLFILAISTPFAGAAYAAVDAHISQRNKIDEIDKRVMICEKEIASEVRLNGRNIALIMGAMKLTPITK